MNPLDLTTFLTTTDPKPAYIVEDLLYQGQMIVDAGEPGVGKSFLMYQLSMCMASGLPFLGRRTLHGTVLYFDEENSRSDLQQYLRWIWRGLNQPNIEAMQKRLHIEHFKLASEKKRFVYMAKVAAQVQPTLIVIDTATPVCSITDENDNGEASRAVRNLRLIKESAGPSASMIVLKHSLFSHDPNSRQTIRGAKAWLGEVDGVIYHKATVGKPRTDGLRNSRLIPDKVRAFGLRHEIVICPDWIGSEGEKGIKLVQV